MSGPARRIARNENAVAIALAARIASGQIEVLLRFADGFDELPVARRLSKMIDELSRLSRGLGIKALDRESGDESNGKGL